jgi:hypothetical protein
MLPSFLIIGAMKAGTTSLFTYLVDHPQIWMPWNKELDFFSNEKNWERGVGWYEEQFLSKAEAAETEIQAVGEASPNYSKRHLFGETASRVAETLPGVKLVYVIREPVARLQSMYVDMLAYGGEERSIDEAVAADDDYVLTSCYGYQLEPYLDYISRDRIHILSAEDLRTNRRTTTSDVYRFLGVDPAFESPRLASEANQRSEKQVGAQSGDRIDVDLSPDLRQTLEARFEEDRQLLNRLLGDNSGF